jgi:hypothetical protein
MRTLAESVIPICWVIFGIVWIVGAFTATPAASGQGGWRRFWWAPIVALFLLGITYQAFLSGSFTVSASPFVAPPQNGDPTFSFTTPFTMLGHIEGSADPMRQRPIFSLDVTGSRVETVSGRTFSSGSPADYFAMSFVSTFEPPAPTPEPATAALLACALIEHTGLTGVYDVKVQWTPDSTTGELGVSLFTAIQEQLGLKLGSSRGPVDMLVIDHVEKPAAD